MMVPVGRAAGWETEGMRLRDASAALSCREAEDLPPRRSGPQSGGSNKGPRLEDSGPVGCRTVSGAGETRQICKPGAEYLTGSAPRCPCSKEDVVDES